MVTDNPGPHAATPRIYVRSGTKRLIYLSGTQALLAGGKDGRYVLERRKVAAGSLPSHTFDDYVIMLPLGIAAVGFHSRLEGRTLKGLIEPWRFRFLTVGDSLATAWNAPIDALFLTLSPSLVTQHIGQQTQDRLPTLVSNVMPHEDLLLMHLILALQTHVESGCREGRIFEDSVLAAILARLLRAYGAGMREWRQHAGLTRRQYARVKDFIGDHLHENFSLHDIALVLSMSPYHLSRLFRATTGQSLWQFVLEFRVKKAGQLMHAHGSWPLAEVAAMCGFESYSQFVAAFRKYFGQLPSEYRRTMTDNGAVGEE